MGVLLDVAEDLFASIFHAYAQVGVGKVSHKVKQMEWKVGNT